jgi:general secretion pathway protein L
MPPLLLLRLPPPGEEDTEWLTLNEAGATAPTRQRGPLSLAAAVWRGGPVVALAPASQILLAEPQLPPGGGAALKRAVPFALEEQLTEDVDQLSFAIGRRRSGGGTPVAVVSRSVLEGWVSALNLAGLAPDSMYADISLIPENPAQTVLWLEKQRLAVRRPGALPFAVELSPIRDALVVAGVIADPLEHGFESRPKESVILYVTRDDWAEVQEEIEALAGEFESFRVQLLVDGPLPWLARGIEVADAVNLLQGEFARTTDYGARLRRWRVAAVLAVLLLLVHIGAQALQIRRAKHESAALDTEISQVFSSTMPGEALTDPRRQMQTRLERIRRSGAGPQYFLRALQALSGALSNMPKTSISALSYHEDTLDMTVTAPSLAALAELSKFTAKDGLTVEIQSSNPTASGVEAHLQIHGQKPRAHS